ncbi:MULTISPECIES: methylenetetrahydrofolate reductase C-terminal domain-containing protein [Pseudonocardia]|uniref:Methylene-tetrahydrofolate reductase C-terminal-like domain-containing protein n=2 Tax=Pseudonocardia TaxID=1847 RepID=A0A1Y2MKG6_PSEAH|nr:MULTISPECIES: methylenetetrahydrofolate reductase C-terminal domain-containing protein [Pseudonocardia]OSY35766.1 hypothetical protein BG845_05858 [Pseudonocardia autotrophica]TDN74542.1 methylene-tetrahydrofolate reductase-like protein [Pseudonocardia autotrophica]BBG05310.1 hypothetical protein Pdca_65190 [Pseudonocardia autotrophica]GEC27434.1 hypothetical protein PSA01_44630 [Pseudonocardia saturnea]
METERFSWPRPFRPRIPGSGGYRSNRLLRRNAVWARLGALLERTPWGYRLFTATERVTKEQLFGCRMCGQCALPTTGYTCPMTCPKELRNGPCGGVSPTGMCEVHPSLRCVWVQAYERAEANGHTGDLDLLHHPADHREWGRSAWVNHWQGHETPPADPGPLLHRQLGVTPR